jgi:pantothenate kinase
VTSDEARLATSRVAKALVGDLRARVGRPSRFLLGLAGPPGVGKSTLAADVAAAYQDAEGAGTAVVVGMDGFHLRQADLARRGLEQVKGAPQTFDVDGFVTVLRRLRDPSRAVPAPVFDRVAEEPRPDAVDVLPGHRLVVVEGNYLLLDGPWSPVRELLDAVWHLRLPDDVRVARLVRRHVAHGRPPGAAREWVLRSDEANARLVGEAAHRADGFVDLDTGALSGPARRPHAPGR